MKRYVKQLICLALVLMIVCVNCTVVAEAKKDNDVSYSDIMDDEVKKGEKSASIDVEAAEIFGGGTASTTIDSSTKNNDSDKKADKNKVDDTPKTGMTETSVYVPLALLLVAAVALTLAGVKRFGRKEIKG